MKKLAILMSVVMLVAFTASVSMAAQKAAKVKMITGEVVKVDADKGDLVLKVKNKNHTYKAEPKMLTGITPGEKVTVEESGKMVKSIKPAAK
jgi:LEA14-like dessication related protein